MMGAGRERERDRKKGREGERDSKKALTSVAFQVWGVGCGVWCVVCGVWCVGCGVWCVVCGIGVWGVGRIACGGNARRTKSKKKKDKGRETAHKQSTYKRVGEDIIVAVSLSRHSWWVWGHG
jgi:hypothetical protein